MSICSQQEIHSCQVWPAMADASLTSAEAIMADAKAGQDEVLGSFLLKFITLIRG